MKYLGENINDEENVNDKTEIKCLEKILAKLTTLIQLSEFEDCKNLIKLCYCANSIAAQLDAVRNNDDCKINEYDDMEE